MDNEKLVLLIKSVKEKTEAKQARWEETSRPEEFSLSFTKGRVTIDCWQDDQENYIMEFVVFNDDGHQIHKTGVTLSEDDGLYRLIESLHVAVRESFHRSDETIDSMLLEIEGSKPIGKLKPPSLAEMLANQMRPPPPEKK